MKQLNFFTFPRSIKKRIRELQSKPASYWEHLGFGVLKDLFAYASQNVPAYKAFLGRRRVALRKLKTHDDLLKLPISSKAYVNAHALPDLFPHADVSHVTTFSATSGSTGELTYFPRGESEDSQYEYISELFLRNQFEIHKKKTLGIIGFGLGIWIGGIFTYKNFNRIAAKGYPLSLIPIGPNKDLFLLSLKKFGMLYDQVILMGYPPFIKDIIDEAPSYGIDLTQYSLRIFTAAEGFSEEFRSYIAARAGIKNPLRDIMNLYGTVELGTMAHETPLSALVRKLASEHPAICDALFPRKRILPTLAQYHPYLTYFEQVEDEVIGSGYASMPLIRYSFPDVGGVIPFDTMVEKLKSVEIDIFKEAKQHGITDTIFKLPFVYVYERADFTLVLRGANIYPGEIRCALEQRQFSRSLTGRFTMVKKENKRLDEYLEIHVELKRGAKDTPALRSAIQQAIVTTLRTDNSEFADQYASAPEKVTPRIVLWPYQDPLYFNPTKKQRWSISKK